MSLRTAVHHVSLKISPPPRNIRESKEIYKHMKKFGQIEYYRLLRNEDTTLEPKPDGRLIFRSGDALLRACAASPMTFGVPPPPPEIPTLDESSFIQPQTPPSISSFTIEVSPADFDPATTAKPPLLANVNTIDGSPPGVVLSHINNSSLKKDKRKVDVVELTGGEWNGWRSEMQNSGLQNWATIKAVNEGISRPPGGPVENPWGRRAEQIKSQKAKRNVGDADDELRMNTQAQTSSPKQPNIKERPRMPDIVKDIPDSTPLIKLQALPGQGSNISSGRPHGVESESKPRSYRPPPTPVFTPPPTLTSSFSESPMVEPSEAYVEKAQRTSRSRTEDPLPAQQHTDKEETGFRIKLEALDKMTKASEESPKFPTFLAYKVNQENPNQPMRVMTMIPGIEKSQRRNRTIIPSTSANPRNGSQHVASNQSSQSKISPPSNPQHLPGNGSLRSSRASSRASQAVHSGGSDPVPDKSFHLPLTLSPPSTSVPQRPTLAMRLQAARAAQQEADRKAAAEAANTAGKPSFEETPGKPINPTSASAGAAPKTIASNVPEKTQTLRPPPPSILQTTRKSKQQNTILTGSQLRQPNLKDLIYDKPSVPVPSSSAIRAELSSTKTSKPQATAKPTHTTPKVIKRREISLQENDDEPEKKGILSKIFSFFTGKK